MDVIGIVGIAIVCIVIVILCSWCCKKDKSQPIYTTTVEVGPPVNVAPYPTQSYPNMMPQPMPLNAQPVQLGFGPGGYPPDPMAAPGPAPYPTMPPPSQIAAMQNNPPSYAEATGIYAKQSAYNPNFN